MSKALLQQYKEDHGLSQAKIATLLGLSSATVSQYLNGSYSGDVDAVDKKVREMIERAKDKAQDVKTGFVQTATARNIMEVCSMAHSMKDINLVIGDAGLGKTMAVKEYSNTIENVILIETEPTFSPKVMLVELCNKLGITVSRSNHDNIAGIIDKLTGSDRLLIIDEAELLSYKCLEIIRRIHDKSGVGVVLVGMPRLRANLRGKRGEYKQLYSRVGFVCDLLERLPDDDVAILTQTALGTDEFNAQFIKASHGNARRLNKMIRGVNRLAKINNKAISDKMVEKISSMLID